MRAGWYEKQGPADEVIQIGEVETPEAGPGEVRVRMHASGVNPSDIKNRSGFRGPMKFPRIVPHSDGAGVIDQAGDGVDASRVGERVWVYNGQWDRPFGTCAEYIALPAEQTVRLHPDIGFDEGACLGIPGMTAHRAVFADGPVEGKTVLVTGGAGAVGHYGVQLAKWGGATVITTVSSDEKAAPAREAGADHVVNYRTEDVAERVRALTGGEGVDRIVDVDFGGNLSASLKVLKNNGIIATYASMGEMEPAFPFYPFMFLNTTIRQMFLYTMPDEAKRQACEDIVRAVEDGSLTYPIAARFPLDRLAAAHEAVESESHIGNIVVTID
ncbi:MAG: NADPH:quinone reductase [bacterium]